MRKILFVFIISLVCSLVITSCQSDTANQQKNKTEQKKARGKKKKNAKKKKPLPPMNKLTKSAKSTTGYINLINNTKITKDLTKTPRITDDTLKISGIAIDKPRKTAAAGVYVKIGKKYYKTKYGQANKALAKRLKNPKYSRSGFRVNIPSAKIGKGDYEVEVFVVSSDRKNYYKQKNPVKIKIR